MKEARRYPNHKSGFTDEAIRYEPYENYAHPPASKDLVRKDKIREQTVER